MRFDSADDILEAYLRLTALRGQDVTLGARTEPARECENPSCARPENKAAAHRVEINGVDRCARCRTEWKFLDRGSLGVSIRGSAEGIAKRMHAQRGEAADLAAVLFVRPRNISDRRWRAMLAAFELRCYQRSDRRHSAEHQAYLAELRAIVREAGGSSERTIDELARAARDEIEVRASRRGLLAL